MAGGFTCFPHRHGASTVDYVLAQPSFIPYIQDLTVGPRPIGVVVDHALLTWNVSLQCNPHQAAQQEPKPIRYTFTSETNTIYTEGIYQQLCFGMPNSSLDEITQILTETLHAAAVEAYLHAQPTTKRRPGSMPQNSWYDAECREMRITLEKEVLLGIITHKKSRSIFRCLVRRKKRAFITQLEQGLYKLFQSQDSSEAWRLFHEHSPPLPITSPEI